MAERRPFDALEHTDYWCVFDGIVDGEPERYVCVVDEDGDADFWIPDSYEVGYELEDGNVPDPPTNHYFPWQVVKRGLRRVLDGADGYATVLSGQGTLRRLDRDTIEYETTCGQHHRFTVDVIRQLEAWLI